MKKILLFLFCLGSTAVLTTAQAQTTLSSSTSKDEFWGTTKANNAGTGADAVGKRSEGLDARFNTYEDGRKKNFAKKRIMQSKRMKEILKKEEAMHKKHRKDKRNLRRNSRR
ncbi:hypothetical protein [Pontibacter arcticus]|uniref:Uncharacterized protein n=1 Tax=Pontibacter arcticus TaxID=2080288 RepID=A0A364RE56_9BACT|nr:hypothetical protein [Pontibacter arcticus]RAU82628.1 hypothetical protein DP923_09735 [Pontibacter arcticus]